jgi:hypothetical protein
MREACRRIANAGDRVKTQIEKATEPVTAEPRGYLGGIAADPIVERYTRFAAASNTLARRAADS